MTTQRTARRVLSGALLAAGLVFSGGASAAPEIDKAAPAFTAKDAAGSEVSLSDFDGKTVVLEWTNHECPYVSRHYGTGNMQRQQKAATSDGVVWLSIISSAPGAQGHVSPAEADKLTGSRDAAPTKVLLDPSGKVGRAYGARTTPHMYVIDPSGELVYMGGIDDNPTAWGDVKPGTKHYVEMALSNLAAGKTVDPAVTRPYGCSVKYAD